MTGIDSWATVAATNATADGGSINWAEGQAPSTVNNTARQMLADIRSQTNDAMWFQYGTGTQGASGNLATPTVYSSGTIFTIGGSVDVTTVYTVGRRVRAVGSSTGTIYGSISASSYSAPTTTVTVVWDSGSLSNETIVVSLAQVPTTGVPVPSASVKGTKTNDSAAAGTVGEVISSTVTSGAGVSLVSGTAKTITSISLTAGDWDVYGMFGAFSNTSIASVIAGTSLTTNTTGAEDETIYAAPISGNQTLQPVIPTIGVSIASTTTIYLVGRVAFTGTCVGYGRITGRRAR